MGTAAKSPHLRLPFRPLRLLNVMVTETDRGRDAVLTLCPQGF